MKNLWKYILTGLVVAFLCFCWTCLFYNTFHGLISEQRIAFGVGLFLSFEMVVLTGVIVSKIEKNKPTDTEKE